MLRFLFPLAVLTTGLLVAAVRADETPGVEAIKEAITILEARKSQAEKKEDKDKIDRAIADLGKLLPVVKKDGDKAKVEPDLAKLITPALLKKKFAGKAAFNPKSGELTLVYDFTNKDQLKDFDLGDAKPILTKGSLGLEAASMLPHLAVFETLTVTGLLTCDKTSVGASHLETSTNVRVYGNGGLAVKGQQEYLDLFGGKGGHNPGTPTSFKLTVTAKRTALELAGQKGGITSVVPKAGQLILGGGPGGNRFSKLTLTGKVDEEWAKEFFKD